VVDDHPIVRQGLVSVLSDEADLEVVGEAGSGRDAIGLVSRVRPDVVLLDLEMPDLDGVAAIPELLAASPGTGVMVFTAYDTDERVLGAVRAGARGYLLKGASADEIARGIRTVSGGGSYLEPRVATKLIAEVAAPRRSGTALSQREREVLRLVADGLPTKQIAVALSISERTVKFHVNSIFHKLGAENRAQAVAVAAQRGVARRARHVQAVEGGDEDAPAALAERRLGVVHVQRAQAVRIVDVAGKRDERMNIVVRLITDIFLKRQLVSGGFLARSCHDHGFCMATNLRAYLISEVLDNYLNLLCDIIRMQLDIFCEPFLSLALID